MGRGSPGHPAGAALSAELVVVSDFISAICAKSHFRSSCFYLRPIIARRVACKCSEENTLNIIAGRRVLSSSACTRTVTRVVPRGSRDPESTLSSSWRFSTPNQYKCHPSRLIRNLCLSLRSPPRAGCGNLVPGPQLQCHPASSCPRGSGRPRIQNLRSAWIKNVKLSPGIHWGKYKYLFGKLVLARC